MLRGRTAEAQSILQVVSRARSGVSGVLVIRGQPGIGKTELLNYAEGVAEGAVVMRTRGMDRDAEVPFAGLYDLLNPIASAAGRLAPAQAAALRRALKLRTSDADDATDEAEATDAAQAQQATEPRPAAPPGPPTPGPPTPGETPPAPSDRLAIGTGTLSLLSAAAERDPLLVLLDDAQWLDGPSVDAVLFAAHRLRMDRVAILVALRDDGPGLPELRGFDELLLSGLDEDGSRLLLSDRFHQEPAPEVLQYLTAATGGVPLAMVEIARALTADQLAGRKPLPMALPVRLSAAEVFQRRISDLDEEARRALLLAALDSSNDSVVLWRAAAELAVDRAAFERVELAALVTIEMGRPVLTHPLVRAAAEAQAAPAEVRAAHRALAKALERRPHQPTRAWHLAAAAVGPDETAAAALEEAAAEAQSRSAFATAAIAWERSALLTMDERVAAHRLLRAGESARHAGRSNEAKRLLGQALRYADEPTVQAEVECELARGELYHGRAGVAHQLMERAAHLVQQQDPQSSAAMLGQAAFASFIAGDPVRSASLAREARQLIEAAGGRPEVIVDLTLGTALLHVGSAGESLSVLLAAAELAEQESLRIDPDYLSFCALALTWVGQYARARTLLGQLLLAARETSAAGRLCSVLYASAYLEARTGHLIVAYATASEGASVAEATANSLWRYLSIGCLAYIEAARGREESCRQHVAEALRIAAELEISLPATVLDALGLLELALGRPEAAIGHLEPANRRVGTEVTFARPSAPDLMEAYIRCDRPLPPRVLAELEQVSLDERFPSAAALAWRCRGLLAPESDIDAAFGSALALHARFDNPFALARTEFCFGERLRRAGRRADARIHLTAALQLFESFGAVQWVARADAELRAAGSARRQPRTAGLEALTPQELQVALAVTAGSTNREAARLLYLSPKTVEFHLGQVYRKLAVRSRAELAVLVAQLRAAPQPPVPSESGP